MTKIGNSFGAEEQSEKVMQSILTHNRQDSPLSTSACSTSLQVKLGRMSRSFRNISRFLFKSLFCVLLIVCRVLTPTPSCTPISNQ